MAVRLHQAPFVTAREPVGDRTSRGQCGGIRRVWDCGTKCGEHGYCRGIFDAHFYLLDTNANAIAVWSERMNPWLATLSGAMLDRGLGRDNDKQKRVE